MLFIFHWSKFSCLCIVKLCVILSGGRMEEVHIDKITSRIKKLCYGLNMDFVDPVSFYIFFVLTLDDVLRLTLHIIFNK